MNDSDSSFDTSLSEIQAGLDHADGATVRRRINVERMILLLTEEFLATHPAERVRVLPDNRLTGGPSADYLFQIDDYDFRLQLLDAPGDIPAMQSAQLPVMLELLEHNPSTVAVVLVWMTDDLLAVPFTILRIRYLAENLDMIANLLAAAQPLNVVLRSLISRQVKYWDTDLQHMPNTKVKPVDLRQLFDDALDQATAAERGRSYMHSVRKQAASEYPILDESRRLSRILDMALQGASRTQLAEQLIPTK